MATERSVLVRLKADTSDLVRGMATASAAVRGLMREVDTTNDRTAWLAQSILALGPALVPLGAAGVPIVAGLATQMTLATGAAVTAGLAFNGVGDALGAVNDYQLEPTTANFEKMQLALEKIGPAGAEFVAYLDKIGPQFSELQMVARKGMFPGVQEGIDSFLTTMPKVRNIIGDTAEAMGDLTSKAGAGLAGEGFADFFDFLDRQAKPLLTELGQTVGNLIEGLAGMMVAFEPLTVGFSRGFLDMSESFADWSHQLDENATFQAFLAYIEQSIPKAQAVLGALSDAFVSLIAAAAPVGDVMLPVLETMFDAIAMFLDSPFGPMFLGIAAAMSVYGRAAALASITTGGLGKTMVGLGLSSFKSSAGIKTLAADMGILTRNALTAGAATQRMAAASSAAAGRLQTTAKGVGKAAGAAGILAFAMSDLDDKAGLTNTTMGAMMGMMAGPWGAAVGGGVGLIMDLAAGQDAARERAEAFAETLDQQTGAITANTREMVKNQLYADGMYERAERLGIGLQDVTDAALGYEPALNRVNDQLDRFRYGAVPEGMTYDEFAPLGESAEGLYEAVNGANGAIAEGREKIAVFGEAGENATGRTASGFDRAADAAQRFRNAIIDLNELLADRASLRGYEAALDDAAKTLNKVKDPSRLLGADGRINIDIPKAREVQEQLDDIAARIGEVSETMKGAERNRFLTQARRDMIDVANKLFNNRKRAAEFVDYLLEMDKLKAEPKVDVDIRAALAGIGVVEAELRRIPDERVAIYVDRKIGDIAAGIGGMFDGVPAGADGMTVPGQRLPYGDKTLILAAPGEEVITNRHGQADRFRADRAAGRIPAYADGGTVSAMQAGSRHRSTTQHVSFGRAMVDLRYPNGDVQSVEMVARSVARSEINADRTYRRATSPRSTRKRGN